MLGPANVSGAPGSSSAAWGGWLWVSFIADTTRFYSGLYSSVYFYNTCPFFFNDKIDPCSLKTHLKKAKEPEGKKKTHR